MVSEAPAQARVETAEHPHDEHGLVQHQFDDLAQQRECFSLGMWLFLATEVMMFGGLFFAYTLYRWKFSGAFHAGSEHLNITAGTINTFVLLTSSLTMALAVHAAAIRNRKRLVLFLTLTWLLGAAFIGVKAFEWTADYREGLIPGVRWTFYDEHPEALQRLTEHWGGAPHQVMMYFVLFFSMTGLHALHMVVGLILVGTLIVLGAMGRFTNGNDQPVEIVGLYWHLVDIIWVYLFPLLYLIAGFQTRPGGH